MLRKNTKLIVLVNKAKYTHSLLIFPGQGIQKVGMHLPYLNNDTSKIMDSFDVTLNYPVF